MHSVCECKSCSRKRNQHQGKHDLETSTKANTIYRLDGIWVQVDPLDTHVQTRVRVVGLTELAARGNGRGNVNPTTQVAHAGYLQLGLPECGISKATFHYIYLRKYIQTWTCKRAIMRAQSCGGVAGI